jgi:hypothetical protein
MIKIGPVSEMSRVKELKMMANDESDKKAKGWLYFI